MIDLIQRAKALRQELKLSQPEFAVRFGLAVDTYREWERGRRHPEGPARVLLAVILNNHEMVARSVAMARAERVR